jgi:nucleoside-diphosphate-sugar epimerase
MVSINDLAREIIQIAGKRLDIRNIPGPVGVRGRSSHNELIEKMLSWKPQMPLREGLRRLYPWIEMQVKIARQAGSGQLDQSTHDQKAA